MDEILTIANDSKAKNRVIILDCCHSGALGSPKTTGGTSAHIVEGVSILTASKDDEPKLDSRYMTTAMLDLTQSLRRT